MKSNSVYECSIIPLKKIKHESGNLTIIEETLDIPFEIKRMYYLYDIPSGHDRGGHAHKQLFQLVIAVGGSFNIVLNDGENKRTIRLNRPDYGLMIVPGIWRELTEFSSGCISLVLASLKYSEEDYIRSYDDFLKFKKI